MLIPLANVGVPMIFIHWPLMICALAPVIVIEALLIRRWVPLSAREAFVGLGKANLISTLVGVPLAWLVMFALEFAVMVPLGLAAAKWGWELSSPVLAVLGFLVSAAWLGPSEEYLPWMMPAAVCLLLAPSFFLSVYLERRSCARTWKNADPALVKRGVLAVKLASYALLFLLACGWTAFELAAKGAKANRSRADPVASPDNGPASSAIPGGAVPLSSGAGFRGLLPINWAEPDRAARLICCFPVRRSGNFWGNPLECPRRFGTCLFPRPGLKVFT